MGGPWEEYQPKAATPAQAGPWSDYAAQPQQPATPYQGSVLPLSRDAQGNVYFDSDAGILGSVKRAFTTPGDVYAGKLDPNSEAGLRGVIDMAGLSGASPAAGVARKVAARVPTADELHDAARAGYNLVRNSGVEYRAGAVADIASASKQALEADGILANLAPKTHKILDDLGNPPADSVASIQGVEAARRAFGQAAKDFGNPTEQLAASRVRDRIDNFILQPNPEDVVAGPASEAAKSLADARGNYAASARSDKLTGVERAADLRSEAANSGQNYDNAVRSRIASLLLNKKAVAGFNPEEVGSLETIVRGTTGSNIARGVSNLMGGGGGVGSSILGLGAAGAGAATGSPYLAAAGAAVPAIGNVARRIANTLNERAFTAADEATRMRSPLYEQWKANSPTELAVSEARAAVVRAMIAAEENKSKR